MPSQTVDDGQRDRDALRLLTYSILTSHRTSARARKSHASNLIETHTIKELLDFKYPVSVGAD